MFRTILFQKTSKFLFVCFLLLGGILGFATVELPAQSVNFTLVPQSGNGPNSWAEEIKGTVSDVDFDLHKIVLYALGDIWYIQPVEGTLHNIQPDGTWKTGTHLGTRYAALVVKAEFQPPNQTVTLPTGLARTIAAPILVEPKSGEIGTPVTITIDAEGPNPNKNFGNEQGTSKVTFNKVDAGIAEEWEANKIEVKVPLGATSGPVKVTVDEITWIGTIYKRVHPDPTQPNDTTFTVVIPPPESLWPGDTNNDCIVDARDILPIGRCFGQRGPTRENASSEWEPQPVTPGWEPPECAYADANGDGIVDARDVLVIGQNFGKTCLQAPPLASVLGKGSNQQNYATAYMAMLSVLEADPIGKEAIELKEALRQLILLAQTEPAPKKNSLLQNFPNPFNPETWIPYELAEEGEVNIRIYDVSGRLVCTISLGYKEAGSYILKDDAAYWDGRNAKGEEVVSGVYFYQLEAGNFHATKKLVVAK